MDPIIASKEAAFPTPKVPRGPLLFCLLLAVIGCVYVAIAVRRLVSPPDAPAPMQSVNIADDARAFLRQSKPAPLSASLRELLEEPKNSPFESYKHPLVGQAAPDFIRPDTEGKPFALQDALKSGPVIVVFYLGYRCNHCVSQLFDLNEDIAHFRELGATVVALSPDSAATTLERYKQYGRFQFPVLSDLDMKIAKAYGVVTPAKDGKPEDLLHGTFVLDPKGIVRWAAFGETPFGHNATLLHEVVKLRRPKPE